MLRFSSRGTERAQAEWERRYLIFPRVGKLVCPDGYIKSRWLLPGRYLMRWSRTYRCQIYRRERTTR